MLAAGATERYHQMLEAAALVRVTLASTSECVRQKLMHTFLLIQILDNRGVFSGKALETLFTSRIRKAAAVENESAAIPGVVLRQAAVKGKTENPHRQLFRLRGRGQALQFVRGDHALEGFHQRREGDR